MTETRKSDQGVEQALRQAAKLLDDVAEWNRLYDVQIDHEELDRISALLSELSKS